MCEETRRYTENVSGIRDEEQERSRVIETKENRGARPINLLIRKHLNNNDGPLNQHIEPTIKG